jgi:hypothetical protein
MLADDDNDSFTFVSMRFYGVRPVGYQYVSWFPFSPSHHLQ